MANGEEVQGMDQDTQIFYGSEGDDFVPNEQLYGDSQMEMYADGSDGYYQEDMPPDYNGYDVYGEESYEESEFDDLEDDNPKGFRVAMSVFDTASIIMGIVVIFALTTLIVSILSWLRTDITHTFVILQSRVQ